MNDWLAFMTPSHIVVPGLVVIIVTSVYAVNEFRLTFSRDIASKSGLLRVILLMWFIGSGSYAGHMLYGIVASVILGQHNEVVTWRGSGLITSLAGVLAFAGKFHPWRRLIRHLAPIDRQWLGRKNPTSSDLAELVAECRRAVRYGADECLRVLPKVIDALEVLAAERLEMESLRDELIFAVNNLRKRFRTSNSLSPDAAVQVDEILGRLQKALGNG